MKPIYLYYLIDENEKVRYVGITTNVKQRMSVHKREKPKHTFEIIEHFDNNRIVTGKHSALSRSHQ